VSDVTLWQGDCLERMGEIPDGSVDLVLCDLPYGTTECEWDSVIPLEPLWSHYERVMKPDGAVILTANQPFTSQLVTSRLKDFKYSWTWVKSNASGFANAKKQPLRANEDVLVFYRSQPTYNPQGITRLEIPKTRTKETGGFMGRTGFKDGYQQEFTNYPRNVINIASASETVHPTQKPVELMEYLVRTYSNPGEIVLDNTMGSGTTGVACVNTGRNFIGIELSPEYHSIAERRIADARLRLERPHMPPLRLRATAPTARTLFDAFEEAKP
jgi:site-specific DNA-methyltransferase (adenine-specific)